MYAKLVMFDYDQTLVDSLDAFYLAFNMARAIHGLKPLPRDIFHEMYVRDSLDSLLPPSVNRAGFWETFLRVYEVRLSRPRVFKGAYEVLRWLRARGVKTALITGRKCSLRAFKAELRELELDGYFDIIVTGLTIEDDAFLFSKRKGLRAVLSWLRVSPGEAVLVCDYKTDIVSAKAEGIRVIGVTLGHVSREDLEAYGADLVIDNLDELISVLEV